MKRVARGAALGWLVTFVTGAALAQDPAQKSPGMDEILVTAQKRSQAMQEVPIGMSAFTEQFLEDGQINRLNDLVRFSPGLAGGDVGIANPIYSVRGISSNTFGIGGEMSVGVFLDEGFIGRNKTSSIAFMDVQRVEVLKGPQGTLFGRNSSAGAISIISNKPEDELLVRGQFVGGNYSKLAGSATFNLPVVEEKFFARGTILVNTQNGYNRNEARGYQEYDQTDVLGGKVALRLLPNDRMDWTVTYLSQKDEMDGPGYKNAFDALPDDLTFDPFNVNANPYNGRIASDYRGDQQRTIHNVALRGFWDMTDEVSLTSLTTFNRFTSDQHQDIDSTAFPIASVHFDNESADTIGQEFRLSGFWREINWMLGASLFHEEIESDTVLIYNEFFTGALFAPLIGFDVCFAPDPPVPAALGPCEVYRNGPLTANPDVLEQEGEYDSYAIYGDATWAVTDRFNTTVGLRYSYDIKRFRYRYDIAPSRTTSIIFNGGGPTPIGSLGFNTGPNWVSDKQHWGDLDALQPRFTLDYKIFDSESLFGISADAMIYASVSRGFKSGGYDPTGTNSTTQFDNEDVWAYEAGFKTNWWDNRVLFNAAGFYNDYENYQLQTYTGGVISTENASDVETAGLELELGVEPVLNWQLIFTGTYLHSEFKDFVAQVPAAPLSPIIITVDYSGNELPRAPKGTFSAISQYDLDWNNYLKSIFRFEASYSSDFHFTHTNAPLESQDAYWIMNLRATIGSNTDSWRVTAFVDNVADQNYLINALNAEVGVIRAAGSPRYYGLMFSGQLESLEGLLPF